MRSIFDPWCFRTRKVLVYVPPENTSHLFFYQFFLKEKSSNWCMIQMSSLSWKRKYTYLSLKLHSNSTQSFHFQFQWLRLHGFHRFLGSHQLWKQRTKIYPLFSSKQARNRGLDLKIAFWNPWSWIPNGATVLSLGKLNQLKVRRITCLCYLFDTGGKMSIEDLKFL